MFRKVYESVLPATVDELWEFHQWPRALEFLTPPGRKLERASEMPLHNGALHVLRFRLFGVLPMEWRARISEVNPPYGFVDTAEKSPFAYWRHHHEFAEHADGALLRDTIDYFPPFGNLSNSLIVSKQLDDLFAFRHRRTREGIEALRASDGS